MPSRRNFMSLLRIAVTADTYPYASDVTNLVQAPFAPRGLIDVIHELGAIPVILPDVPQITGKEYADAFDALILPGGPDTDPTFFGEEPIAQIGTTNYKRDHFESSVFKAFYRAGKLVFGICRGCQLINILLGGSVYQDLKTQNPQSYIRHSQGAPGGYPTHHVTITENSLLYHSLGKTAYVNSRHHQAVKAVGQGLKVTAQATDGVIEAVESIENNQILAVQWHPENMWQEHEEMKKLFSDFIDRVKVNKK